LQACRAVGTDHQHGSEGKSVTAGLSLDERAPRSLASRAVSGNKGTSRFDIGKT